MDVYAVPVGGGRYELYCEVDEAPGFDHESGVRQGVVSRLVGRFRQMLADAERERQRPRKVAGETWTGRFGRWLLRHMAEAIAEQRLLWHLRGQATATLVHPDDLDQAAAREIVRRALGRDRDRHRLWLLVDGAIAVVTGPLFFFVPGPNLVAYYFVFRAVGHFFAWRGARRGLDAVSWRYEASAPLGELRAALALPAGERPARVRDVEARLRLQRFAAFVSRVAVGES